MDSYPHRDFGDRSSRAAACGSVANLGSVSILSQKTVFLTVSISCCEFFKFIKGFVILFTKNATGMAHGHRAKLFCSDRAETWCAGAWRCHGQVCQFFKGFDLTYMSRKITNR